MSRKANKLKQPAANFAIPRDRDEADEFIFKIGEAMRDRDLVQAALDKHLAALKAEYEEKAAPIMQAIAWLTSGLQTWAEANRHELLKGDAKTVKLGNGSIAWKNRPPKVNLRNIEKILAWLEEHGQAQFIRTTKEINKEAMLADPAEAKKVPGVSIGSAGEDFIVTPLEAPLEDPEAA